jgi:acetyl esterase/lipase
MNLPPVCRLGLLLSLCLAAPRAIGAEPFKTLPLWPGTAPGETGDLAPERDTTKPTDKLIAGKPVIRLGNVSTPTISIYRPPATKDTGAAVVVCPGGGYSILAWDLEGTEVCDWLNSIGVTGVLLKYRVPKRKDLERYVPPLQDAQRTLGLVRQNAKEWGIDPKRVGILGFSAGAHLSAALSCNNAQRTYPAVDDADKQSCRPDFAVLIYPGLVVPRNEPDKLSPELKVTADVPPTFLAQAADDPVNVQNALVYAMALKNAKVPFELHVYPTGGHGYGLRRTSDLVTTWPDRAAGWMKSRGLLEQPK